MWVSCQVHMQHSHSCYYFQQSHQELRTDPKSSTESRIWHKGHLWFICNNLPIITCFVYLQFETIRRYVLWTCLSFRSLFLGHLLVLREVFPHSNFTKRKWMTEETDGSDVSEQLEFGTPNYVVFVDGPDADTDSGEHPCWQGWRESWCDQRHGDA